MDIIKHRNELFSFHLCNFLGKQTEAKRKLIAREREREREREWYYILCQK